MNHVPNFPDVYYILRYRILQQSICMLNLGKMNRLMKKIPSWHCVVGTTSALVGIVAIGSRRRANVGIPSPALLRYVGILSERDGWHIVVCRCFVSGHRWLESSVSRINVVVQPDYRYINYIFKHHDQKNYYTSNLNKMYHFAASILFYDIAQLRFPSEAIWVQQVVSTVFPGAWLRKIRQCFFAFRQLYRRFL